MLSWHRRMETIRAWINKSTPLSFPPFNTDNIIFQNTVPQSAVTNVLRHVSPGNSISPLAQVELNAHLEVKETVAAGAYTHARARAYTFKNSLVVTW